MNSAKSARATTVPGRAIVLAALLALGFSISSNVAAQPPSGSSSVPVSVWETNRAKLVEFLGQKCGACHGARNRVVPDRDVLDVDNPKNVVWGQPSESALLQSVKQGKMPPSQARPLGEDETDELTQLIEMPPAKLMSIMDTARADPRLSTLVRYAVQSGLDKALEPPAGPFTILATMNEGFEKLSPAMRSRLDKEGNNLTLAQLLVNHAAAGEFLAGDLEKAGKVTVVSQLDHTVERKDGRLHIGNAAVVQQDIQCSNGVIHVVDRVIPYDGPKDPMRMVEIPGGQFVMGSKRGTNRAFQNQSPQRTVQISPFLLGAYEVTRGPFLATMGWDPSIDPSVPREVAPGNMFKEWAGKRPVQHVTWLEAVKFCNALSQAEGFAHYYVINTLDDKREVVTIPNRNGNGYRLPTEAEWEYACRAGSTGAFCFGDNLKNDPEQLVDYAWIRENTPDQVPQPFGEKLPNAWGLCDMHGNVREWVQDWYGPYQPWQGAKPLLDPTGPSGGKMKVFRGGSYVWWPDYCRSASRASGPVDFRHLGVGLRVARTPGRGELGTTTPNR